MVKQKQPRDSSSRQKRVRTVVYANGEVKLQPSPIEREKALARTLELYHKGWTQYQIAEELGVSQPQVCNDLKLIRERAVSATNKTRAEWVAEQLVKIDLRRREAWAAWERSKKDRKKTVHEENTLGDSYGVRDREEISESPGDAAFLSALAECDRDVAALLGLNAPSKVDLQGTLLAINYAELMMAKGQGREGSVIEAREVSADPVETRLAIEQKKGQDKAKRPKG